jgi:hypothetical protein
MEVSGTMRRAFCVLGGLALLTPAAPAVADQIYPLEKDIPEVRLGQRIMVDDGSCPAGQIKQITGAKLTATGVMRAYNCVPRFGAKKR